MSAQPHPTSTNVRMLRALVEAHVDPSVSGLVIEAVDELDQKVQAAADALERVSVDDVECYWSVKYLMQRWGCSDEHVRRLIRDGELEEFRPGTRVRIPKRSALAYEERRTTRATPPAPAQREPRITLEEARTLETYPWLEDED